MPWKPLPAPLLSKSRAGNLLASKRTGFAAVSMRALPMAFPISYALLDQDLVVRTSSSGALLPQLDKQVVTVVAHGDQRLDTTPAWLVAVTGRAHAVSDPELLAGCRRLALPGYGPSDVFVRIPLDLMTGYEQAPSSGPGPSTSAAGVAQVEPGTPYR